MPPEGTPAPAPSARQEFVAHLETALDAAAAANPNPGARPPHRLNRFEYSNAARDLLDLDVDITTLLPGDDSGYGFDNIAGVLSLSPSLVERYMVTARRISRLATGNQDLKPSETEYRRNKETSFTRVGDRRADRQDLPFGATRGTAISHYFPLDGEYEIEVGTDPANSHFYGNAKIRIPVKAGLRTIAVNFLRDSSRMGKTRPKDASYVQTPLDVRLDGVSVKRFEVPPAGKLINIFWVSVNGPYNVTGSGDTPSRRKIFSCNPSSESEEEPCAREILTRLSREAYRRPVNNDDLSPLIALYQLGRTDGGDFERGIERAIQALLVSPSFLFRVEDDPEGVQPGTPYRLNDFELASRLAFFLWSSSPDSELLRAAERQELQDPAKLDAQVRRMLRDPKAKALIENFAGQWLQLRNVDFVKPDEVLFPTFDINLRQAMKRETELFFGKILHDNRSVMDLLDANFTFLNEPLAKHYGIKGGRGPQFREGELDDPRRGGLLGHASVLTVSSYPNRTAVVIRGKWVLDNLLGMPPPPAPADVPSIEEATKDGKKVTLREIMAQHSTNATCAACHVRMDPLGFALENYNAIGQWRNTDGGSPIDSSGKLPGGFSFNGPVELKKVLSTEFRAAFVTTVAEKLLVYALGRGVEYYDKPTVREIVREARQNDYRLADLIVSVTKSMPFQMRRSYEHDAD